MFENIYIKMTQHYINHKYKYYTIVKKAYVKTTKKERI